jgi:hypothetical protein
LNKDEVKLRETIARKLAVLRGNPLLTLMLQRTTGISDTAAIAIVMAKAEIAKSRKDDNVE